MKLENRIFLVIIRVTRWLTHKILEMILEHEHNILFTIVHEPMSKRKCFWYWKMLDRFTVQRKEVQELANELDTLYYEMKSC